MRIYENPSNGPATAAAATTGDSTSRESGDRSHGGSMLGLRSGARSPSAAKCRFLSRTLRHNIACVSRRLLAPAAVAATAVASESCGDMLRFHFSQTDQRLTVRSPVRPSVSPLRGLRRRYLRRPLSDVDRRPFVGGLFRRKGECTAYTGRRPCHIGKRRAPSGSKSRSSAA
jgi:hypothetical protein